MLILRKCRPTIRQQKKETVQLIMDNRHRTNVISVNRTLFWIWLGRSLMFTKYYCVKLDDHNRTIETRSFIYCKNMVHYMFKQKDKTKWL